jgi:hypothetical protein
VYVVSEGQILHPRSTTVSQFDSERSVGYLWYIFLLGDTPTMERQMDKQQVKRKKIDKHKFKMDKIVV